MATDGVSDQQRSWWRDGVIYQIYPRSFMDSNGDGVGDLRGIMEKLDYLSDLGISGIWLSPVNTSPMFDFGYDVSDYRGIDPLFGSTEDFTELISEAHRRNIRIIMDVVLNHTSHLHPWFIESASSRDNPKRDWYIWHDGSGAGSGSRRRPKPPNNWLSIFGGKAWEWNEATRSYYLHSFVAQQPDLNWFNPEVKEAALGELKYWLDRGVDGFRFDVINWFGHDREFRSNPFTFGSIPRPYEFQKHIHDRNFPVSHDITREFRALLETYDDRMMVCEVYSEPPGDPALSASYVGPDQSNISFDFRLLYQKWNPKAYVSTLTTWEETMQECAGWPCYVLSNHDQPRSRSRFGSLSYEKAKVAAVMHMTLRGTPFLYYGEEIGMENRRIKRSQLADPVGKRGWPLRQGRDPVRTPMQWDTSAQAGFTTGTPWLPVHQNVRAINVRTQQADDGSLLILYRKLIALRNDSPVLQHGEWTLVHDGSDGVISYYRSLEGLRKLVVLNFSKKPITVESPAQWPELTRNLTVDLSTHKQPGAVPGNDSINLAPLEATIFRCGA